MFEELRGGDIHCCVFWIAHDIHKHGWGSNFDLKFVCQEFKETTFTSGVEAITDDDCVLLLEIKRKQVLVISPLAQWTPATKRTLPYCLSPKCAHLSEMWASTLMLWWIFNACTNFSSSVGNKKQAISTHQKGQCVLESRRIIQTWGLVFYGRFLSFVICSTSDLWFIFSHAYRGQVFNYIESLNFWWTFSIPSGECIHHSRLLCVLPGMCFLSRSFAKCNHHFSCCSTEFFRSRCSMLSRSKSKIPYFNAKFFLLLLFIVEFEIHASSRSCTWRSDRQLEQLAAWSSPNRPWPSSWRLAKLLR